MTLPSSDHAWEILRAHARDADERSVWPTASWLALGELGGLGWALPREFGGEGLTGKQLLERYETLAGSCLTTAFLLSQREAGCRRLLASGREDLSCRLLPDLVRGDTFITVGLAQLTTSRQHGKPAVTARTEGNAYIIDGAIPWVTGAPRAEHIVVGAAIDDQQLLVVLPTDLPGVHIGTPLELAALQGSLTAEVRCDGVRVDRDWLLAGPAPRVLGGDQGGTGGLETSCLALGLASAAVRFLQDEARSRPQLESDCERLRQSLERLRQDMFRLVGNPLPADATQALRAQANALVLHATQAALAAAKGTGFLREHPAQRWARQALFFLVWSCPWPVTASTMAYLVAPGDEGCS